MHELEQWLEKEYDRAYRTACMLLGRPDDAGETVQQAFLRTWRFRASLPRGDGWQAWLYRSLISSCSAPRATRPGTAEASEHALASLPDPLRVVVILRFWTGLSEREIATALRRRPGTVKSRLHEARSRLAEDPTLHTLSAQEA